MKKNKEDIVNSWIKKAGRDLEVSKRELKLSEPLTNIICFHARQTAEKYMKAYLIWLDIGFQKTHDIEDLVVLASKKDPSILELKDYGAELSSFAVEVRYPEFDEDNLHPNICLPHSIIPLELRLLQYIINFLIKFNFFTNKNFFCV